MELRILSLMLLPRPLPQQWSCRHGRKLDLLRAAKSAMLHLQGWRVAVLEMMVSGMFTSEETEVLLCDISILYMKKLYLS